MESAITQRLTQRLIGNYKMDGNRLVSKEVEIQVCKRLKPRLEKGQSRNYLMLNRLEEIEFIEDSQTGENKPYISGLYPTQKKDHFEFSVNGSEFELVLKSETDVEVRGAGSILKFSGSVK